MFLVYTEEGSEPVRYEFRPGRIRSGDASTLLRHYKRLSGNPQATWQSFVGLACPAGDPEATRLMLWYCQHLDHPKLRVDDVDPLADEVEVELDRAELLDMRAQIAATKGMSEAQRELILDRVDLDIAALDEVDDEGKAPTSASTSLSDSATSTTET